MKSVHVPRRENDFWKLALHAYLHSILGGLSPSAFNAGLKGSTSDATPSLRSTPSKSGIIHTFHTRTMASSHSRRHFSSPSIMWNCGTAAESDTYAGRTMPPSNIMLKSSQDFSNSDAEDFCESGEESIQVSGSDNLDAIVPENLSLPSQTCFQASASTLPNEEGAAEIIQLLSSSCVDFNFVSPAKGSENGQQIDDFDFRHTPTAEYLDNRELEFKELLSRERNRAAAKRSNSRKKSKREAEEKELSSLRKWESELRVKELALRGQNRHLRALVYKSEQTYRLFNSCWPGFPDPRKYG